MHKLYPYLILTLLCLALYLPGITTIPVTDRDEAHFAQASRQMLSTGNYFQVRFQEKTRYQKPPGINWLQALSVATVSDAQSSEIWPYRIPSVLGGLFSVLLTFGFCRSVCGEKTALLAAGLLAITLLLTIESHIALTDPMLLATMVLMQGSLWLIYLRQHAISWYIPLFFWLAMSAGFALKGVTPLVGILTIITLCCIDRNVRWLKHVRWHWGILLFLLTSSWLFFVSQAEQSNYLMKMFEKDLLPKLVSGHESHGALPGYHLLLLALTLWPTSLFLWHTGIWTWQHRKQAIERFLIAWIAPTWLFFEIMPTKLPQYVLPTFPAIAILAALAIINTQCKPASLILKILCGIWGFLSIAATIIILIIIPYLLLNKFLGSAVIAAILISAMVTLSIQRVLKQKLYQASIILIIGVALIYPITFHTIPTALPQIWTSEKIARATQQYSNALINEQTPLLAMDYTEPSLVFVLGTKQVEFVSIQDVMDKLTMRTSHIILVSNDNYDELKQIIKGKQFELEELSNIEGFNYSKGRWIHLKLIKIQQD